jgi:hypothetical protein
VSRRIYDPGPVSPSRPRRGAPARSLCIGALLAALAFAGCGEESTDPQLGDKSLVNPKDLPEAVISEEDRDQFEKGSAEIALLDYWQSLQFQDLADALGFYEPGLRRAVGEDALLEALRSQSSLYRVRKPGILEDETETEGDLTTVRYVIEDLSGGVTPHSVTFRKRGGEWRIVFSSLTGEGLLGSAQARRQVEIDPSAQSPGPEAQQAGARAAQKQQDYLDSVISGD